ncbi:MAG: hypothetical protein OEL76_18685 [Siculibacillus sp.]|nr:hypothetical protein [Siculibacillus sp.]
MARFEVQGLERDRDLIRGLARRLLEEFQVSLNTLPEKHPRCDRPPNDAILSKEEDAKSGSLEERTIANGSKRHKSRISQ